MGLLARFLALCSCAVAALCWAGWVLRARNESIVVIGAGIAGIAAAHDLREAGYRVTVVEARDRIGGRIYTNRALGTPIELGAAFIHSPASNPVTELAERYNITTLPYNYSMCSFFGASGEKIPPAEVLRGVAFFKKAIFHDFMEERDQFSSGWDEPMRTTLERLGFYGGLQDVERTVFDILCFQHIVQDLQAELDGVSSREYERSFRFSPDGRSDDENDLFVASGFDTLLTAHLGDTPLQLSSPVTSIAYQDHLSLTLGLLDVTEAVVSYTKDTLLGDYSLYSDYGSGQPPEEGGGEEEEEANGATPLGKCSGEAGCRGVRQGEEPVKTRGGEGGGGGVGSGEGAAAAAASEDEEESIADAVHRARLCEEVANHAFYMVAATLEDVFLTATEWWVPSILPRPGVLLEVAGDGDGSGRQIRASHAVVTLPIGCLKKKRVAFDPPLPPPMLNAISDLSVSSAFKVALCWEEASVFWNDSINYFHKYPTNGRGKWGRGEFIEVVNLRQLTGAGCMLVEVETAFASRLAELPKGEVVARVMEDIRLVYPGAPDPEKGSIVADFATSPYSDGGYVHWPPDTGVEHSEEFEYPLSRRVFWAGEHTLWAFYGNTHGAYLSGRRAARQIVECHRWMTAVLVVMTLAAVAALYRSFR